MTNPKPRPKDEKAQDQAEKPAEDLVDAASEMSFPASDPPSYMGGAAVAGPPPEDDEPAREPANTDVTDPATARPKPPQRARAKSEKQDGRNGT
jgi:hypothetical protein